MNDKLNMRTPIRTECWRCREGVLRIKWSLLGRQKVWIINPHLFMVVTFQFIKPVHAIPSHSLQFITSLFYLVQHMHIYYKYVSINVSEIQPSPWNLTLLVLVDFTPDIYYRLVVCKTVECKFVPSNICPKVMHFDYHMLDEYE